MVTAQANPNIAFIKYWGNQDDFLRIPLNGSISMNLAGLTTTTAVRFDPVLKTDKIVIDGLPATQNAAQRVTDHLDLIRSMAGINTPAEVISQNNFPMGSGIASSASAFAALSLAASKAAGLELDPIALSRLARRGSGSACRSVPPGIVEWQAGGTDNDSYAEQLVPSDYWDLVDCLALNSEKHKNIGSTEGHRLAKTSPLQALRISDADRRLSDCRKAIMERDFDCFAEVVEQDSNLMHSVMSTSNPPLNYWNETSIIIMQVVNELRTSGIPACYTLDAGPNVHVITRKPFEKPVQQRLERIPGIVRVISATTGDGVQIVN